MGALTVVAWLGIDFWLLRVICNSTILSCHYQFIFDLLQEEKKSSRNKKPLLKSRGFFVNNLNGLKEFRKLRALPDDPLHTLIREVIVVRDNQPSSLVLQRYSLRFDTERLNVF